MAIYSTVDTSAFSQEETLFFIRIKGKKHFFNKIYGPRVMQRLFGHITHHHTISEYRNADHYIDLDRYTISQLKPADYDVYYSAIHQDLPGIMARCRGLRAIPYEEAKELVQLATKFFKEFFSSHRYRLVVIAIIDNYILDVMCRVARHLSIQVICMSEWFIEHYRRHTFYGELIASREPSDAEVVAIENRILSREKNFWLRGMDRWNRIRMGLYLSVRYWILLVLRYHVRYRLLGDRSYECRFVRAWRHGPEFFFIGKYFDAIDEQFIQANRERIILLPLHTFPEANVDYWMTDYRDADYYSTVYEAISFFRQQGYVVVIKEHPWFLYQRPPKIYARFKEYDNVRLIDPMSASVELLEVIPTVLVWHGSMGIEALLQGKKVVAFDTNYYSTHHVKPYRQFATATTLMPEERQEFIRSILRGVQEV